MTRKERIRKIVAFSVYILTLSSIQVTFPDFLTFRGQVADMMLVFVVMTGYFFGSFDGAVVGLVVGFIRDYFAGPSLGGSGNIPGATLGIGMLVFMYIGIFAAIFFTKKFHRRVLLGFAQILVFTIIYKIGGHIMSFLVQILSGRGFEYLSFNHILLDSILPQIVVNLIVAIPVILLIRYLGPYKKGVNKMLIEEMDRSGEAWQIV
jgi:hypothetical protein